MWVGFPGSFFWSYRENFKIQGSGYIILVYNLIRGRYQETNIQHDTPIITGATTNYTYFVTWNSEILLQSYGSQCPARSKCIHIRCSEEVDYNQHAVLMTWKMEIRNKNLFAFKLLKSLRSDFMNWRVKEWIPTAFSTPLQTLSRFKAHLAIPTTQFLWSIEVVVRESCCIIVTWFVQLLIHWFSKDGLISIGNLSGIKGIHTHNWTARCWTRMRPVGVVRYKHSRGEGYCPVLRDSLNAQRDTYNVATKGTVSLGTQLCVTCIT